jgi:uncharacterized protein YicC (UPF0701 family)
LTRLSEGEPGNDQLAAALGEVVRELREDEEQEDGRTFRAVVRQQLHGIEASLDRHRQEVATGVREHREAVERRVARVEQRQDAILLLIAAAVAAQAVLPFVS